MDSRNDLLVHTSELYYHQNLNQNEIARILGISRPTVSRLLEEARDSGIVEIVVHNPIKKNPELSSILRNHFKLREAIVIAGNNPYDTALLNCAKMAAKFLSTILDNNMSIGLTWGRAINAICNSIQPKEYYNVNVVQMAGCLGTGNPQLDGLELALRVAKKFSSTYSNIIAPIYVDDEFVYNHLISSSQIKSTLKKASHVDIALTGIGSLEDGHGALALSNCYSAEDIETIKVAGGVGHILGRIMDCNGNEISSPNHFPISAPLSAMHNTEWSIAVCASAQKAKATLGVINGRYANCLIVDEPLAEELMRLSSKA